MGKVHPDKPHVVAALAKFCHVLVTVQGEFETFAFKLPEGGAVTFDSFFGRLFGVRNNQDAKGCSDQILEVFEDRGYLLVVPDAKIVKAEKELACHVAENSKNLSSFVFNLSSKSYLFAAMFESIILGLLQGLAEFLPISSSGHLVLGHEILGMNEAGMFFDIMLHAGTLLSIFVVFHKKITDIIVGCIRRNPEQLKEAGYIVLASIPTALIGLGFKDALESLFENPRAVCVAELFTGLLLFTSQWGPTGARHPENEGVKMNWWRALVTGTVQGIACIPGISRSGSTISAMMFMGVNRKYAGEFSFLMSIPAVGGAALLDCIKWIKCQTMTPEKALLNPEKALKCVDAGTFTPELLVGMLVAFVFGIVALKWLMNFVQKGKFQHFAWYVWAVGILGLIFI